VDSVEGVASHCPPRPALRASLIERMSVGRTRQSEGPSAVDRQTASVDAARDSKPLRNADSASISSINRGGRVLRSSSTSNQQAMPLFSSTFPRSLSIPLSIILPEDPRFIRDAIPDSLFLLDSLTGAPGRKAAGGPGEGT